MTRPVQVLVLGFEEPEFTGAVMAELDRLKDAGVVRLVDVLLVARTADGGIETLPAPAGADPDTGRFVTGLLGEGDSAGTTGPDAAAWSLEDAMPATGAAAIALIEHTWAQPLVGAIRAAGGRLLDETWLAADDLVLLETLAGSE